MKVISLEQSTAFATRDREFNIKLATKIKKYWERLGHKVELTVRYDKRHHIHVIETMNIKDGLPTDKPLTTRAKDHLTRPSKYYLKDI